LGNGPELADKLSSILPKNYLIRLVDTASLSFSEQISIMRKTNYFIGVHGAGLSLSIFMPSNSIFNEILPKKNNKLLLLMSSLSGHKSYSDILKSNHKKINNNDIYFFDTEEFAEKILKHIKENYY
jgi:protein O-GlcNAc transferase